MAKYDSPGWNQTIDHVLYELVSGATEHLQETSILLFECLALLPQHIGKQQPFIVQGSHVCLCVCVCVCVCVCLRLCVCVCAS